MNVLTEAIPLQVHRATDYPPMADQLAGVFSEVMNLRAGRNQQVRKAGRVRQHLNAVILDLWIAANYSDNPWRAISRNRNDFARETRYRKIYLKYDLLIGVIDDLLSLGYIDQKIGFHDRVRNRGYQTRIKATDQFLNILTFNIKEIVRNPEAPEDETIIKKDASGKLIDYVDDRFTNETREFLKVYNNMIRNTNIDTNAIELRYRHDVTSTTLKQIFKEDSFGRFYGCYWQTLPKEDRALLKIENEPVVELDYSALHPTIAYAFKGIELTEDPYTIDGCERSEVKNAFLVLFNCRDRRHAINTIRSFGIKNVAHLITAIEEAHTAIKGYFYNPGFGGTLQNTDSWIAETVMKRLMGEGIVCLPVHDSFIVAKKYEQVLRDIMAGVFYEKFCVLPRIH